MNPIVKVCSHPRSGTHLLEANLYYNFYNDGRDLSFPSQHERGHWNNKFRQKDEVKKPWGQLSTSHPFHHSKYKPAIYIIRDVRDVALSLWKTKACLNPDWGDISFSDFLNKKLDWYKGHAYKAPPEHMEKYNIFEHWSLHVMSWYAKIGLAGKHGVLIVFFEDLVKTPVKVLNRIAVYFGLTYNKIEPIEKLVGFSPNKGKSGLWKDFFTEDDLKLCETCVPKELQQLCRAE